MSKKDESPFDREDAELALSTFRGDVVLVETALSMNDAEVLKEAEDRAYYGHGSLQMSLGIKPKGEPREPQKDETHGHAVTDAYCAECGWPGPMVPREPPAALLADLIGFVQHKHGCVRVYDDGTPWEEGEDCACGLEALLQRAALAPVDPPDSRTET